MASQKALIKNPLITQKEEQLKKLQKAHNQLLKKLQREKVKLEKLKEEIVSTQRNTFSVVTAKMEQIQQLKEDLKKVFEDIKKSKRISRQEKRMFKELANELVDSPFDEFEQTAHSQRDQEEYRQSPSDFFNAFVVKPDTEEGQNIRKIFLRLATKFHPDKARNPKEVEKLHSLMQRINQAYKRGDIAELLEIEAQYVTIDQAPEENEEGLADFLQKQIDRMDSEVQLLEDQVNRTKTEIKNINRSEVGKIYKQFKGAHNPLDDMTADLDQAIESLRLIRDGLREYVETGLMPDYLSNQLYPQEVSVDELELHDILDILFEMEEEEYRSRNKASKKRKK